MGLVIKRPKPRRGDRKSTSAYLFRPIRGLIQSGSFPHGFTVGYFLPSLRDYQTPIARNVHRKLILTWHSSQRDNWKLATDKQGSNDCCRFIVTRRPIEPLVINEPQRNHGTDSMAPHYDDPSVIYDMGLTYDSPDAPVPPAPKRKQMKNIIKLALSRFSIIGLIAYLQAIYAKMNGNAAFTTLAAKTTALNTAVTALETANTSYTASLATTNALMTVRDNAVITAQNAAQDLANGAETVTKDPATLQSGGWDLASTHASPVGPMAAPANFHATSGDNPGEVDLGCDTQAGVQTHMVEYSTSATGPFTLGYTGKKSSCAILGLVSGTIYWFQMWAVGAAGPGPKSGPLMKRAT